MEIAAQHGGQARQLVARQNGKALARRLEMDHHADGDEVQDARDGGGDRDAAVRQLQRLGHDECRGAHDRRDELAAHGRARLHTRGEGRTIAGALHQRDREGAGRDGIRDGAAVDHPEEPARDDGHLARPATRVTRHGERAVGEEAQEAAIGHHAAEHDEQEDERGGHERGDAEHALRRQRLLIDQVQRRLAAVGQKARQSRPDEDVGDEGQRHDHERGTDVTPGGGQQQRDEEHTHRGVDRRRRVDHRHAAGQTLVVPDVVGGAQQRQHGECAIEPPPPPPSRQARRGFGRLGDGIGEESERDGERDVHGQLDQQVVHAGICRVELEHRPRHREPDPRRAEIRHRRRRSRRRPS
jgi:hypothetical protein